MPRSQHCLKCMRSTVTGVSNVMQILEGVEIRMVTVDDEHRRIGQRIICGHYWQIFPSNRTVQNVTQVGDYRIETNEEITRNCQFTT